MLFPISTDAPLYHRPWATILLIVANVFIFVVTGFGFGENAEAWILEYGSLSPLEWVSCNFVHFGFMHLIGNMFFLWTFGVVVEGKIGLGRFLLVYFGIGILHALVEQLIMLGYDGMGPAGSGGASGAIFGLMAISLVWAPKNDVTIVGLLLYRPIAFDVAILWVSVFYIGLQILFAALSDFAMSSEVIHLLGAAVGFGFGVLMLKKDWVDCENWDLFAVIAGTHGSAGRNLEPYHFRDEEARRWARQKKSATGEGEGSGKGKRKKRGESREKKLTDCLRRFRQRLDEEDPQAALEEYRRWRRLGRTRPFPTEELHRLARELYKAQQWDEVEPILEECIDRSPEHPLPRLMYAGLLLNRGRPRRALRQLKSLDEGSLSDRQRQRRGKLESRARRMIEQGVVEPEGG